MDVLVAGGHGQIALLLHPLLARRGDRARALIRDPAQAADVRAAGAEPVLGDLEASDDLAPLLAGADAVVFAAGAGPGSGAERKRTLDRDGAVELIAAAQGTGVDRYVMVSAMGAASPPQGDEVFAVYLRAKAEADAALAASGLDFTVIRPGRLTDDPPTGRVTVGPRLDRGAIPRADVAAVLAETLHTASTVGATFDLLGGPTPVTEALASL